MAGLTMPRGWRALVATLGLVLLGGCGDDAAAAARDPAARGRQIYHAGTSPSGDELGVYLPLLGDRDRRFPARRYACAQCHGEDGLPSLEAGVDIPGIQAHRLGSPAHAGAGSTRSRPAYDRALLARAIRHGIDAGGNRLNVVMPRFEISDRDLDDLLTYLATLGNQQLAGVTATRCVLGIVVDDAADTATAAMVETLRAFAKEANARGGIYGRELTLVERTTPDWDATLAAAPDDGPLSLIAVRDDADLPHGEVPLLVLGGEEPLVDPPPQPRTWHLHPSQAEQLCVGVDHTAHVLQLPAPQFVLLLPDGVDDDLRAALRQRVAAQIGGVEGAALRALTRSELAELGEALAAHTVLLAGAAETKLQALQELGRGPLPRAVYCTHRLPAGSLRQVSAALLERLRLLLPVPLPAAASPTVAAFQDFLRGHGLPERAVPQRVAAMAGGIVLAEALKRCGTRASRDRLAQELGALHQLPAGLFAPVTFSGGRHVGVRGAQVVRVDPESMTVVPCSDWCEPR